VDVTVNALTSTGTSNEVEFNGRYLTNTGHGPTGAVDVLIFPAGNRPPMFLGRTFMFNGWFSLFAVTGVNMDYRVNGISLFGGPHPIESLIDTADTSQIKAVWPAHYETRSGQSDLDYRDQEWDLVGFFGPGVTTESTCYSNPGSAQAFTDKYLDEAGTTALEYYVSGTDQQVHLDLTGRSGNTCATANSSTPVTNDGIYLDPGSGSFNLHPPFISGQGQQGLQLSGSTLYVSLLPDLDQSQVSAVTAFYVPEHLLDDVYKFHGPFELYDCDRIAHEADTGAGPIRAGEAVYNGSSPVSVTLSTSAPTGFSTIVCPRNPQTGGYYQNADVMWSGGGSTGTPTFANATVSEGLGSNVVNDVTADYNGLIYAATTNGLSISSDGGASFVNKTSTDGLASSSVNGVYTDISANIYAATTLGLSLSTDVGSSFSSATTSNSLPDNFVSGVAVDSSGNIYAGTISGLAKSATVNSISSFIGLSTSNTTINNVFVDMTNGNVYAATAGGVAFSTDGGSSFTYVTTSNGLGSDTVHDVFVDGSGNGYVATDGGLAISPSGFTTFNNITTSSGLASNTVTSVAVSGSGTIYAGTSLGLSVSQNQGSTWTTYTSSNGLPADSVTSLYLMPSGCLLIGTTGGFSKMCYP
jgi:hypothetical protein